MAQKPKPDGRAATSKPATAAAKPKAQRIVAAVAKPKPAAAKAQAVKPARTAAAKPAASKTAAVKAAAPPAKPKIAIFAPVAKPAAVAVANDAAPAATSRDKALKKKDLIDRVLAATGARKKLVKDVVEATLKVLGEALTKGETLNMPPFGKAKVSRSQEANAGKAMTVKLRRGPGVGAKRKQGVEGLAD